MRAHRFLFAGILFGAVALAVAGSSPAPQNAVPPGRPAPTLVLLSFDGFRPDYLERFDVPNLQRLIQTGVRAEYLIPVFPTKTYPNLYELMCHVLGFRPAPNDGRLAVVAHVLSAR